MMDIYSPDWGGVLEKIWKEWVHVMDRRQRDKVVMGEKIGESQLKG